VSLSSLERVLTPRLVGERVRTEHAAELAPLIQDPRVVAWLSPGQDPPDQAYVKRNTADKVRHWERFGFGLWLLRDRETGEMVGRGGLQWTYADLHEVEVAWVIVPERWGEGLATELAHAAVAAAFDTLDLADVIALTLPYNVASRRVMEKASFIYEREIECDGLPHVLYRRRPGLAE
jgi:RimJ/RimL family protein N-acetyltransferase